MTTNGVDIHELEKLNSSGGCLSEAQKKEECKEPEQQKWKIIMEPALIGAMVAINLSQTSLQILYLRTACMVDLKIAPEICDKGVGEEFRSAEAASQTVVSQVNVSRSFVGALISTIILLFVGPWSDCSGRRKPIIILPLVGMCVMTTCIILLSSFPGFNATQTLYAVQIPMSLGGNFGLMLAGAFSHIGDVCHATGRDVTRTMGTHRAAIQIAHVMGAVSGPLLYRQLGFHGVFPIALFLQFSSLIFVIVYVKDVNVNPANKVSVVNWRLPFLAIKCLVRARQDHRRTIIFLMLLVGLSDKLLLSTEVMLAFMYYRKKFNWDDITFGLFLAYRNIVSFLGTMLILTLLKRRLRLSDEAVGVLSCLSYLLATSGLIAARHTYVVFLRKIYSVLGALESATLIVSSPLYNYLYSRTVKTMADAWLLPCLALATIQLLSFVVTRKLIQKSNYHEPHALPEKLVVAPQVLLEDNCELVKKK
ncbi:proton-coupled folate transporter-like isoform X2 [Cydia amplana]|uniref:proton-coupled folate transporter-like isoform X2 n=1 Tax=Cydia amplana TaxID=1869771 RepID=UPI002FE66EC8